MTATTPEKLSARDRLLAAANELFYEEGVNSVGIDRVIEHAGVAKASLYSAFGSKDELIKAYLLERHQERAARYDRELARYTTPREKLLGVFDVLGETFGRPTFHGCAFINASSEARPGSSIEGVADISRNWVKDLFTGLATDAGAADPRELALQLAMVFDGAVTSARMDRRPEAADTAKQLATIAINAALPTSKPRRAGRRGPVRAT
jgi:AcrR family transcriptional regulator